MKPNNTYHLNSTNKFGGTLTSEYIIEEMKNKNRHNDDTIDDKEIVNTKFPKMPPNSFMSMTAPTKNSLLNFTKKTSYSTALLLANTGENDNERKNNHDNLNDLKILKKHKHEKEFYKQEKHEDEKKQSKIRSNSVKATPALNPNPTSTPTLNPSKSKIPNSTKSPYKMQHNLSIDGNDVDRYVTKNIDDSNNNSNNISVDIERFYEFDISKNHNDYNINQEIFNLNKLKISSNINNVNIDNNHNNDDKDGDGDRNYDNIEKNMYKQKIIDKCNAMNILKNKPTIDPRNIKKNNNNDKNNDSYNKENENNNNDMEIFELSRKQILSSTQDKIDLILQKNKLDLKETREKLAMASLISIVSIFINLL
jgi:hypothetical protein